MRTSAKNLNSGDSFVLLNDTSAVIWHGKLCNQDEKSFAEFLAKKLAGEKNVTVMNEGSETPEFWEKLGGKAEYPKIGDISNPELPARLFQITDSVTGGHGINVVEIFNYDQEDLCDDDVMLLDTYREVYFNINIKYLN